MKHKRIFLTLLILGLSTVLSSLVLIISKGPAMNIANEEAMESEPTSSGSIYGLPDERKEILMKEANSGDKDAAFTLYQHFAFSQLNDLEENKWLEIAARNGHIGAQYNLAVRFKEKRQLEKALYWANEALKNGEVDAAKLIDEINRE